MQDFSVYKEFMDKILIGKIIKPQGIKGELKVLALTDTPEIFAGIKDVYIDGEEQKILSCRVADGVYISLKGVADRNAAEEMRNKDIFADKSQLPEEDGRWFISDILGCLVVLDDGGEVGTVMDVTSRGSTDIFTAVKNGRSAMFPFLKELIVSVDLTKKRIVIKSKRFEEVVLYED